MENNKNILIINLGSPDSLDIKDVRSYLNQFLSDDLVIDLPKIIQQLILKLFILPFRPRKTKIAYESIWTKEGSPLINNTKNIAASLSKKTGWNVDIAMRYKNPSIENAILNYKKNNVNEIIVFPLYPHSAISTTLSTELKIKKIIKTQYPKLKFSIIQPFYNHPLYIKALSKSISPYIDKVDKIIFSYHGIPERHLRKGDQSGNHCLKNNCCEINCLSSQNCYKSNVFSTSKLCAQFLNLNESKWITSFQSRVSIIDPNWLRPYTDQEFERLPKIGIKKLAVICPSFVADCLETLEEINIRGKKSFLQSGGEYFKYIPCLNNNSLFISMLEKIILNIK
tara:strand:+ start:5598 stop:6614 length:1017 start_codon:yes stop_codon:yes gene_type:complete